MVIKDWIYQILQVIIMKFLIHSQEQYNHIMK